MMDYLIVSATEREIRPLLDHLGVDEFRPHALSSVAYRGLRLHLLHSGVGMMETAYHMSAVLSELAFDHAVQAGVAGSFDRSLAIGDVFFVDRQRYGDLGATVGGDFRDVYDMGLSDADAPPFRNGEIVNDGEGRRMHAGLRGMPSISVNRVSDDMQTVDALQRKYGGVLESMEGAAFHYACGLAGLSYAEIRSVSNYAGPREGARWDLETAIKNLNQYLVDWLSGQAA